MLQIEKHETDEAIQLNVEGKNSDLIFRSETETGLVTITAWDDFAKVKLQMNVDEFMELIAGLVGFTGPSAWDLSERIRESDGGWTPGWHEDGRWSSKTREARVELIADTTTDISTVQIIAPNMEIEAVVVSLTPIKEDPSED